MLRVTYSHEATIAAVSDYYNFLTKLYLKDSQVLYPPDGGWPSITTADSATLACLGKSDEVVTLLAHLPNIHDPGDWHHAAEGVPGCFFAEWQHCFKILNKKNDMLTGADLRLITEGPEFCHVSPPHVVGLTNGDPIMVLDTKLGIIHWNECPSYIEDCYGSRGVDYDPPDEDDEEDDECGDDEDEDGDECEDEEQDDVKDKDSSHEDHNDDDKRNAAIRAEERVWRESASAWPIHDFFKILKDQFRKLQWIPISQHEVWDASWSCARDGEGMIPMLRDIYHQHGWPDFAQYRKSECLAAVQKALKERYPSYADVRSLR
ncbi:hypothetical protein CONLIGDRAFT_680996 [Coniochaeta ligniaria NRRL 30616]|uniref:Uncharacterized protein n=1 Tax=Coniochaeta ligniaria NRRL 30616 TaxID=1408157 RepID=A0A1J7JA93_9PEZI|nr:hypothetical protein CONLIGDRAFT_680996 [Coniochaeta ligniaria NRRL 30616]